MSPKNRSWPSSTIHFLRRYHFVIVSMVVVAFFIAEGVLLYRYFYRPYTQTKLLSNLKQQTALEDLKIPVYERLVKFYAEKQKGSAINWNALRDPFLTLPPSSSAAPRQ